MEDQCRYIIDRGKRVLIPGCIGAANRGPHACNCPTKLNKNRSKPVAPKTILANEASRIKSIHWEDGTEHSYSVGVGGCEAIEPYDEHGERDYVPWLRVVGKDNATICRLPASMVSVHYSGGEGG